jgi:hypothetical protein
MGRAGMFSSVNWMKLKKLIKIRMNCTIYNFYHILAFCRLLSLRPAKALSPFVFSPTKSSSPSNSLLPGQEALLSTLSNYRWLESTLDKPNSII